MISIKNLHLTYHTDSGPVPAVRGVSIEIPSGGFHTLLGPSGCGKTSTLRCVAGLERPDSGEITLDGEIVFSSERGIYVPPYRRRLGMVFQSYAIWPHMDVFGNVAYPLKYGGTTLPKGESIRDRVSEVLDMVGLRGLEKRPAPLLSGGQQQRLALARALVARAGVLLLDEPLSNLDARLRDEMRHEIRELTTRLRVTTLFVTHDQLEAFTMSDTIGVMNEGVLVQEGPPLSIYRSPTNQFVANFVGRSNVLEGKVCVAPDEDSGLGEVDTPVGTLTCQFDQRFATGEAVAVLLRPEDIEWPREEPGPGDHRDHSNVLECIVNEAMFLGPTYDIELEVRGQVLKAIFPSHEAIDRGRKVTVHIPAHACHVMRKTAA